MIVIPFFFSFNLGRVWTRARYLALLVARVVTVEDELFHSRGARGCLNDKGPRESVDISLSRHRPAVSECKH